MSIPAVSIYASFILSKHELELRGPLSQQIIRFTRFEPNDISPHIRVDNVTMERLVYALRKRLRKNYKVYKIVNQNTGFLGCTMLYAIPTVRIDDYRQYNFVSSHRGARTVLMRALKDLCCKYSVLTPDIRLKTDREDPKGYWTLTAFFSDDLNHHILKVFPGRYNLSSEAVVDPTIAMVHVKNVQLADILYLAQCKNELTSKMIRFIIPPRIMTDIRHFEMFRFCWTQNTSKEVLNVLETELMDLTNQSKKSLFSFSQIMGWAYKFLKYIVISLITL